MENKVILVKTTGNELEKLLNEKGWKIAFAFSHPSGTLIVLNRQKLKKNDKARR